MGWSAAPSVARFTDALLRGELLSRNSRRELLQFVPAEEIYDGYGLGIGKVQTPTGEEAWAQFGAGPSFQTSAMHIPAKGISVAVLSSGEADVYSIAHLLADGALDSE